MDLKAISCRIEWSLFQVHSTKHARASYNFYNKSDHKATIVALWCQRVKGTQPETGQVEGGECPPDQFLLRSSLY